jgi:hypothetical protein
MTHLRSQSVAFLKAWMTHPHTGPGERGRRWGSETTHVLTSGSQWVVGSKFPFAMGKTPVRVGTSLRGHCS